ncbi:hypothetical protein NB717_003221 [Xanthomonas sacchari]|nr:MULTISPECIES: hypothetical protein [Xanthomonas]MCW0367546.1 hypothetical protein [Xanthomonas sacchari]MCW0441683.1 hypothetical protein [Xanthomonas sacchari]MCW0462153.1 hypothetical protein [Xanthomonas sacchari]
MSCRRILLLPWPRWRSPLSPVAMLACTLVGACVALAIGAAMP